MMACISREVTHIQYFMQQLRTYAQNPQESGRGTQWTLLGSSTLQRVNCDLTVHPESA